MTLFYHPLARGALALWLLFVCFALVWAVMRLLQQKRYKALLPALLFFAACDIYWQYLNANSYYVRGNKPYYIIDLSPVWLIIAVNAALSVAAVVQVSNACADPVFVDYGRIGQVNAAANAFDVSVSVAAVLARAEGIQRVNAA